MKSLIEDVERNIRGDVFSPCGENAIYETDESIFKIVPKMIVCPQDEKDVQTLVEIAHRHQAPITARGGGTGIAGQSIGPGIIVDFSRDMSKILDMGGERAIVQPGVVLKNLNVEASKIGKTFAPDPGSKDHCTIGGMIATNAAGPRALVHGSTRNHVQSLEMILEDGKKYSSQDLQKKFPSIVAEIEKKKSLIESCRKKVEKNSSGYFLDDFEKLFVGSEGTLGLVTQATIKLVDIPRETYFAVFGFPSLKEAMREVKALRESKPSCLELLNKDILQMFQSIQPNLMKRLNLPAAGAALWVEWNALPAKDIKKSAVFFSDSSEEIQKFWTERSQVSKHLHREAESKSRKPLRCIEDACVPIHELENFVDEVQHMMVSHDAEGAIFGHAGSGHLHVNPNVRIDLPNLSGRVEKLMNEFYDVVLKLGGTISGEHGDGLLRVKYARQQWGELWHLFETVKRTFDPKGIFNPDKKVPVVETSWPRIKFN